MNADQKEAIPMNTDQKEDCGSGEDSWWESADWIGGPTLSKIVTVRAKPKYNHAYTVAFSLDTDAAHTGKHDRPSEAELIAAIRRRVDDLEANSPEIYEAVEPKWDPFEIEESDNG
tara:strand:+ start:1681 stop:2028 length:348 start_codon:yes stop_codon:yes gene_type:complete